MFHGLLSPPWSGVAPAHFPVPSRTTLTGPKSGTFSPPTVRSTDLQVNELASMGVSSVVAVTFSPSGVTAVDFAAQPLAVRVQAASPSPPPASNVHDRSDFVAGSSARTWKPLAVWPSCFIENRPRRKVLSSVHSNTAFT